MSRPETAQNKHILWGAYCSLYTGKIRAYLIKKGIEFVEINPSHPHYVEKVLPTIGYFSVPVIETPTGEIIQDSTDIIIHFEKQLPQASMLPEDKPLQAIAWLIHNYGTDGLLTPAMHYRWNYKAENYEFIMSEFERGLVSPELRASGAGREQAEAFGKQMNSYLVTLGVTDSTIDAIEQSTMQLFDILNEHFVNYPYLLGGKPSIADCGMMAGLYAHLSRDPHPAKIMKDRAPALYRWTETMNRPGVMDAELWHIDSEFFNLKELPDTLIKLLTLISADFGNELTATSAAYNDWLATNPDCPAGTLVGKSNEKSIRQSLGFIEFQQQSCTIKRAAWADTLLCHQYLMDVVESMSADEKALYTELLEQVNGQAILNMDMTRPIGRKNYAAVIL